MQQIKEHTLDSLLEEISVMPPGLWENDLSDNTILSNWYAVANDEGIIAYFRDENEALGFRLNYINRLLNY